MSLDAMTRALGETLAETGSHRMTLIQASEKVLSELLRLGYEVKPVLDTGLSPMKQGVIELHEIFSTMMEQGFEREEAFALVQIILEGEVERWSEERRK